MSEGTEEKFEEFLKRESQAYNTPGETPRDEMWQVIAAARAKKAAAPVITASKSPWLKMRPWISMAATLLLGVGIGRYALKGEVTPATQPTESSQIASAPSPLPAAIVETPNDNPVAPTSVVPTARRPRTEAAPAGPTPAITVASREHMQRAEALISVVAATPMDAAMDSLTGRWARDMLSNTRLLLDSPAGEDPVRRQILEDLETVLVLLLQRSGVAADDRALVDRSLQRTQLLTRLRTSAAGI